MQLRVIRKVTLIPFTRCWWLLMPAAVVCGGCAHRIGTAGIAPAPSALSRNFERQAVNAIDAGDGDYEAKVLRARLNADPQDLSARLELARHYWKAGFPEVAIE